MWVLQKQINKRYYTQTKANYEKSCERKIRMEMLFIYFKQAFDPIDRKKLIYTLKELETDNKLIRLITMTIKHSKIDIKTQKEQMVKFIINKRVRL